MQGVQELTRDMIVGDRRIPPAPRRLPRFEGRDGTRARPVRRIAAGALLCAAVIGAVATAVWIGTGRRGHDADIPLAGAAHLVGAPAIAALSPEAQSSDGGQVARALPTMLYDRRPAETGEPVRTASAAPEPLRTPRFDDSDGEAAAVATVRDGTALPASLMVARSNLVWSRLFGEAALSYRPVRSAPLSAWAGGQCAARPVPEAPAYCPHDQTVYLGAETVADPLTAMALSREIGRHVQAMLGVAIRPLAGADRELQADCFAGLLARQDSDAPWALAPSALRRVFADDHAISPWERDRIAAFSQGYVSSRPQDCDTIAASGGPRPAG